jgi:integrase
MASIFRVGDRWRAQIRRKGHDTLSENFATKQDAQRWARQHEHQMDKGKRAPLGLQLTVGEVIAKYLNEVTGLRGHKLRVTEKHKVTFANVRIDECGKQTIFNYVAQRELEGAGPATIKDDLSFLRTALQYGGGLFEADEAVGMALARMQVAIKFLSHAKRIGTSNKRERRPTEDELILLQKCFAKRDDDPRCIVPIWDIILIAICTAMRLGEIVGVGGIVWEDLDVAKRTLWVRNRKDPKQVEGNDSKIPLLLGPVKYLGKTIDPLEIILRQPTANQRTGRIFPHVENTISVTFMRAAAECGIENLHFHDLRHDGVSRLFEHGFKIEQVALVSGHRDWKSLKRYTNLKPESLHGVMVGRYPAAL